MVIKTLATSRASHQPRPEFVDVHATRQRKWNLASFRNAAGLAVLVPHIQLPAFRRRNLPAFRHSWFECGCQQVHNQNAPFFSIDCSQAPRFAHRLHTAICDETCKHIEEIRRSTANLPPLTAAQNAEQQR